MPRYELSVVRPNAASGKLSQDLSQFAALNSRETAPWNIALPWQTKVIKPIMRSLGAGG